MIQELLATVAPIYVIAGLGFAWVRLGRTYDPRLIGDVTMNVGVPSLVFVSLTQLEVAADVLAEMALATAMALGAFALIGAAGLRLLGAPVRTFLAPLVFPNSGNMGLAVCLFAFGESGLALGVVFFAVTSITHFTLGLWVWSGESSPMTLVRTPLVWSVVIALAVMVTDVVVPRWIVTTTTTLGGIAIPLMQFTLGVQIAQLEVGKLPRALAISVLRLAMGLAVGVVIAGWLELEGVARGVLILDCAMPVAVVNALFAERYGRAPAEVASTVVLSTLLSFLTLPLVLAWLNVS